MTRRRIMKALLMLSFQHKIKAREERIRSLDEKVVALSRDLDKDELRSQEAVIDNDYFLKLSEPTFCRLPGPDQLLYLALWHCERTRSASGNRFTIQAQKQV